MDTGASRHLCRDRSAFTQYSETKGDWVTVGNGQRVQAKGCSTVVLHVGQTRLELVNVLHVVEAPENLLSVGQAVSRGLVVTFTGAGCSFLRGDQLVASAGMEGTLFVLHA